MGFARRRRRRGRRAGSDFILRGKSPESRRGRRRRRRRFGSRRGTLGRSGRGAWRAAGGTGCRSFSRSGRRRTRNRGRLRLRTLNSGRRILCIEERSYLFIYVFERGEKVRGTVEETFVLVKAVEGLAREAEVALVFTGFAVVGALEASKGLGEERAFPASGALQRIMGGTF